jgi:tRNA modification GTPase
MDKALECAAEADLLLLVLDGNDATSVIPAELLTEDLKEKCFILFNKSDLYNNRSPIWPRSDWLGESPVFDVSARTGSGLNELIDAITRYADRFKGDFERDLIAINSRHSGALGSARSQLNEARKKLGGGEAFELLASDLRGALACFGEIVGKIDNEAMLDRLFATFCIGK